MQGHRRARRCLSRPPLVGDWPYLWLEATYLKQREGGRVVSVAAMIVVAANTDGEREIVGLHTGPSEAETFWATFLKASARRGLRGVKLVIPDPHGGPKTAIRRVTGASWQRCRVHRMRNALSHVPKGQQSMVSAALRQAFIQPDRANASQTLRDVADQLRAKCRSPARSSTKARPTCWRTWTSPSSTAASSTARTPSSA